MKSSRFNPFARETNRYGAPLGRYGDDPAKVASLGRLHAKHQGGGDGYDRGGAYWGYPYNVWAVWGRLDGEVLCAYVRAENREAAMKEVRYGT